MLIPKWSRWLCLLLLVTTLTGCFYWIRAYRTYLQMGDFDQYFSITSEDEFSVYFKEPILYSDDFISLSKLQPSSITTLGSSEQWRYWFRKVDEHGEIILPEIKFYFDLIFNEEERLTRWSFSPVFLQIAPAEFLEVSLRSLAHAKINKDKRQLRADPSLMQKVIAELPKKAQVLSQLGEPLSIDERVDKVIYHYHFKLETQGIEKGYEGRALSRVKLIFNKETEEVVKMAGRFVGLKISIDYQKYIKPKKDNLALVQ